MQAEPRPVTCACAAYTSTASDISFRVTCSSISLPREITYQRSEICTALGRRALLCSALQCSAQPQPCPPGLQLQKRHDKMVAALLHRVLRVLPWPRQRGLRALGVRAAPWSSIR